MYGLMIKGELWFFFVIIRLLPRKFCRLKLYPTSVKCNTHCAHLLLINYKKMPKRVHSIIFHQKVRLGGNPWKLLYNKTA